MQHTAQHEREEEREGEGGASREPKMPSPPRA